jgi:hypothetical protein
MTVVNQDIDLATSPADVRRAFLGGTARKQFLGIGHQLYKFTHHPLFKSDGTATPWWSSVRPLDPNDPGLEGTVERAERLGVSAPKFARARTAVRWQWNQMTGLLRARLLVPVYALLGRCAGQPYDEADPLANVVFIGGAWQLWIPNLSQREIVED